MMRIAVVGSGIAGLSAAYYLSRKHQVWLFEKDQRIGGHTHTVTVESSRGSLAVDTGFIVFNDRTYPNLIRLFAELGVQSQPSDMSFAVTDRASGYEYSSRGLRGFYAQPSNLFRLRQHGLLAEILRFNREAPEILRRPENHSVTLGDVLTEGRYSDFFLERYLYPMAAAVWSMSTDTIPSFPAYTLLRFFDNHGMLGIDTHPKWRVVRGGSSQYLAPLTKPFADRIVTGAEIASIARQENSVRLRFHGGKPDQTFDQVVFACHGNQILPLLEDPSDAEREVLAGFRTSRNEVCLHTDSSLLPARPNARASWNYNLHTKSNRNGNGSHGASVTYHMNRLQGFTGLAEDYCITLNASASINPAKVVRNLIYHHPVYDRAAILSQAGWSSISGQRRTHFCGAYWFYGFHEDGLKSALRVAQSLGVEV